ncbi:MAG: LysM peptidoglycan-binding domain-containing protein, partial [Gammaproteobacteria bacterium]
MTNEYSKNARGTSHTAITSYRFLGLWQFIPDTGASFGLKQNWWYDGRRDIIASTEAAITYLERLNNRFEGDWELALAAYNAGGGTVQRAIKLNQQRGKPTDYWSLKLRKETEQYVPKLIAIAQIVQDPAQFQIAPLPISNRPHFAIVDTSGQLDLAKVSELSGVSLEDLYRLNPGLNRWTSDPEGPHRIAVPVEKAEKLRTAIANIPPSQRITWHRYTVKYGDNLINIAQHFNTSPKQLRSVNHIRDDRIKVGMSLLIPEKPKVVRKRRSSASRSGSEHAPVSVLTHRVEHGDTLWGIAKKFNTTVDALA